MTHPDKPTEDEITPEMIEAGVLVGCLYDMRQDDWREVVREIYSEMRALEGRREPAPDELVSEQLPH